MEDLALYRKIRRFLLKKIFHKKTLDFCVHRCYYICVLKSEVKNMSKKMGRPTTNPKNEIIKIRATKDDREKLLFCCEKTKKTQYDVVMEGIDKVYSELKK